MKSPEIKDFTERELFAWAALEAMEDAGVVGKDIDAYYVSQVGPGKLAHQATSSGMLADWIGMRYKPNISHDEGCTGANGGLHQAVMAVASGMYDMVLSGGTGVNQGKSFLGYPPHLREDYDDLFSVMSTISGDPAYVNPGCAMLNPLDAAAVTYAKTNHLTLEQVAKTLGAAVINARNNAIKNPKALYAKESYESEAKRAGFDDVFDYLNSPINPPTGTVSYLRYMSPVSDGASALIVCATDKAKKLVKQPIEVIGIGGACCTVNQQVGYPWAPEQIAFQNAYQMAGITDPYREVEYMGIHDCNAQHYFTVTETAGYFRPGEGWKGVLDGRIAYNGDRPVNTSGGRLALGHPLGGAAGIEIAEAVSQMRGVNGARQMPKPPRTSVVQSFGAGFHIHVTVLRTI
jgi:acetyl-CoA C-acetyltransferase